MTDSRKNYIESADEETLIFIFSNSGKYITEYQNREGRPPKYSFDKTKAKIVLVTSNEQMLVDKRVDEVCVFRYARLCPKSSNPVSGVHRTTIIQL